MIDIPDFDLFMVCDAPVKAAFSKIPSGFHVRSCRRHELDVWKAMLAKPEDMYMVTDFFNDVYAKKGDLFFEKCLFICDEADVPVGTCLVWKAYEKFNAIHWYKVKKEYEGRGLGRGLFSAVMESADGYPIYLHTHPASVRAIKLYSDFGFKLIKSDKIGDRENHLEQCLPILKKHMPADVFDKLGIADCSEDAVKNFIDIVNSHANETEQF